MMSSDIAVMFGVLLTVAAYGKEYDVVLAHGRVMDPASGLDGVRYVGIRG